MAGRIWKSSAIAGGINGLLAVYLSFASLTGFVGGLLTLGKAFIIAFIITFFAIAVIYGTKG